MGPSLPDNFWILCAFVLILVIADKGLTYLNLKAIEKNFPDVNPLTAEKNPMARFFFEKFGYLYGNIIYAFISFVTFFLAVAIFSGVAYFFGAKNTYISIGFYAMFIIYGITIANNLFFYLKYSGILK